jgi:hypothetical protein
MWKFLSLLSATSLTVCLGSGQGTAQPARSESSRKIIVIKSPNRRYEVRFTEQRSDAPLVGRLWGKITVRDLTHGTERIAQVANGQRGNGVFEGFGLLEKAQSWSPDGLYLAYWRNYCQDEGSVPGGVVCHLHEVHFLSMKTAPACREELVLSRYAYGGWDRGQPHSALEILINEAGQEVQRLPCADRKDDKVIPSIPVRDAAQAIALFQHYWDSIVLPGLPDENQKKTIADNMSERVRAKKLSAHLASYRVMFDRVDETLTASERKTLVLYGALADLDRVGECWVVESFAGCPCSEVSGMIDARNGQLIFVWVMPEG